MRLAEFVADRAGIGFTGAAGIAESLLGRTVYSLFVRALFGVENLATELPSEEAIVADVDVAPIRNAVTSLLSAHMREVDTTPRVPHAVVAGGSSAGRHPVLALVAARPVAGCAPR